MQANFHLVAIFTAITITILIAASYLISNKNGYDYKHFKSLNSRAFNFLFAELRQLKQWQSTLLISGYATILYICFTRPLKIVLFSISFYYFLKLLNALPKAIKVASIFYLSLVFTTQIILATQFHTDANLYIMASIFETNANEAYELFSEIGLKPFLLLVFILGIQLFLSRKLVATVIPSLFVLFFTVMFLLAWPINKVININTETDYDLLYSEISRSLISHPLLTLPISYLDNVREKSLLKSLNSTNKKLPAHIVPSKGAENQAEDQTEKIILIIGESSAKKHYGAYGYEFDTTPNMNDLMGDADSFHKENDAISPANLTRTALIQVLSFGYPSNLKPFFNDKNIIEMARAKGYDTVWISNQSKTGPYDTYIGAIAVSAKLTYFTPKNWFDMQASLDISLIPPFKENLRTNSKQLIVVHLIGSHISYENKYDAVDFNAMEASPKEYRDYDSSIHHTDRVIGEVNKLTQNEKNVITIYVSDHGENVNVGHSSNDLLRAEYEVPYFWFGDKRNVEKFSEINNKYKSKKYKGVINTSTLPYILSEMMGWQVDDTAIEKIVSDRDFVLNVDGNVAPIDVLR
ncbi:MAG: phosphoethanolamine transferase [Methylophilaceae bacterium]